MKHQDTKSADDTQYTNGTPPPFDDVLVLDEAHRLVSLADPMEWTTPEAVQTWGKLRLVEYGLYLQVKLMAQERYKIPIWEFDRMVIATCGPYVPPATQNGCEAPPGMVWQRASDLQHEVIEPIRWCIPGLISEGLFTLAGRPKKGKSMLALNLAMAKATGGLALGKFQVEVPGDVAYLALEDGKRRVKYRIEQLMAPETAWPERLWLSYLAPRTDTGLTDELSKWADGKAHPALVIVDILARVTPHLSHKGNAYDAEYQVMAALMDWASQRQIALGVITHTTKAKADNIFETVMSTTANVGATATNMLLVRHTGDTEATCICVAAR